MKRHCKIGLIGTGNMGSALIRGLVRSGPARSGPARSRLVRPREIIACDTHREKLAALRRRFRIHTTTHNHDILEGAETLILAVKPQNMPALLAEIKPRLRKDHLVISIAAGIDTKTLRKGLGSRIPVVRVMPNLPALIHASISGIYCTPNVTPRQRRLARQIFEAVGTTVDVPRENWLDAITGLSGTGPAYVFALMEGLLEAGKKRHLPAAMAYKLVLETVCGAAQMAAHTGIHPKKLREQVTSKKGTTWAAMKIFKKYRFWELLTHAVAAAAKRAQELRG